jgi:hypothetical protein
VFRLDLSRFGMPTVRLVFDHAAGVGTTVVHTDLGAQPASLDKQPAARIARVWLGGVWGALAVAGTVTAIRRPHSRSHQEMDS